MAKEKRQIKRQKSWRPMCREGMVSIRRKGRFFAVVCRTHREADIMEKYIIRALVKARR